MINKYVKFFVRVFFAFFKSLIKFIRLEGFASFTITLSSDGKKLTGKRIIITGGTKGIGLSIAKKFLSQDAFVLIVGRSNLNNIKINLKNNEKLFYLHWDITDLSNIKEMINKSENLLGGSIDILVNNAGVMMNTSFFEVTEYDWNEVYKTNSKSTFFISQELCSRWLEKKNERKKIKKIINISSQGAFVSAESPYRMSKWDIVGLTQGLALKFTKDNIIVNSIAPGIVRTNMIEKHIHDDRNIYCSHTLNNRSVLADEVAEVALFLASDVSNSIVGQTIVCDCGFTLK